MTITPPPAPKFGIISGLALASSVLSPHAAPLPRNRQIQRLASDIGALQALIADAETDPADYEAITAGDVTVPEAVCVSLLVLFEELMRDGGCRLPARNDDGTATVDVNTAIYHCVMAYIDDPYRGGTPKTTGTSPITRSPFSAALWAWSRDVSVKARQASPNDWPDFLDGGLLR